jgi:pimeloyl-ACP methyl ester carboxylesterase
MTLPNSRNSKPRRAVFWLSCIALLVVVLIAFGAGCEVFARWRAAEDFPPPGKLVDIGGRRIHLDCRGAGSPTVVFESGSDNYGALGWSRVHDAIAGVTRTCAYDRAGIMWSDPALTPQDGLSIADDLEVALVAADETGPLLLVGHSLGGLLSLIHANAYPDRVAGLVLIDPAHPDQEAQFSSLKPMRELLDASSAITGALSALSWTGLLRLLPAGTQPGVPDQVLAATSAHYPTSLRGMRSLDAAYPSVLSQAAGTRSLGDRPLLVLSAPAFLSSETLTMLALPAEDGARFNDEWLALHRRLAALSTAGEQRIVPDTGHFIQFEQPDAVIGAVLDMVKTIRRLP